MIHDFTIRAKENNTPVLRCSRIGCRIVWWPDRNMPKSECKGREPVGETP